MIITIVCDVLGKENNGTTIAAMNLIRYLKEKGHTVKVLCPDNERKNEKDFYIVPLINFGVFNHYVEENGVFLAKADKSIIKEAIKDSDIVHVMLPFSLGKKSCKIAKEIGLPVTAGFHQLSENLTAHVYLENGKIINRLTYSVLNELYKHADAIHFPTKYLKELYEKMFGPCNGYVISNGVNDCFVPLENISKTDKIRIIYTGRYSREKNHKVLIDAIMLSKYKDKIELVLAGAGPLENKIKEEVTKLPIKPIMKSFSHEEMVEILNSCYLYVHCATIEAEGIGCLEAMACGIVPIISNSNRCATQTYAIDEKCKFDYDNPQDLANKIDWFIDNPKVRDEYSKKYIEYAKENLNQEKCMMKMEKMFIDTLEKYNKK